MIINIPTSEDFQNQGIWFLNLAWDAIFDLQRDFKNFREYSDAVLDNDYKDYIQYCNPEKDKKFMEFCAKASNDEAYKKEIYHTYWKASQKSLSIAHVLSQQGVDLILKAKIAEVSPFLLISNPPKDWPKECNKKGTDFADFRTIDAQDLVRVYNTICLNKLTENFSNTFEKFRKTRNAVFHTIDERLAFSTEEILTYILDIANLIAPKQWPQLRQKYLASSPTSQAIYMETFNNVLCEEMNIMIELLGQKQLKVFFDFEKKQRRYICPKCYYNLERDYEPAYPTSAQLKPNEPSSTNLYCFVCGENTTVIRKDCKKDNCKGNVINSNDDRECLTCFEPQDIDE